MRIDAHQHFWKFDPVRDAWITDEMQVIRKDFFPEDLQPLLKTASLDGCVAVQADQSEQETNFLLQQAQRYPFIKGVVGWIDFRSKVLNERLTRYSAFPLIKGFRHVLQSEPDGFMMQTNFLRGVRQLSRFRYTYDLLVYPHQLKEAIQFIAALPEQPIVIDHLAKPYIRRGEIEPWREYMKKCASFPHTWCKLSGMVTEANWNSWKKADFRPYLDAVLESFGPNRIMFGSDWPVCNVAGTYADVIELLEDYISTFSPEEKRKVMGENAMRFYNL